VVTKHRHTQYVWLTWLIFIYSPIYLCNSIVVVMCSGDIFYKIKEVDEQGWCTGVRGGHTGLYPENYAEIY